MLDYPSSKAYTNKKSDIRVGIPHSSLLLNSGHVYQTMSSQILSLQLTPT